MRMKPALMSAFAALILLFGCISGPSNETTPVPSPSPFPSVFPSPTAKLVASNGDSVEVDYTVRVENGSVYDTTLESVAREAGIYKSTIRYRPFNFTLGKGDVIDGFDEAVRGMRIGEEKTVLIPPEKAYGDYDPTLIQAVPRIYALPRVESVPLSDFLQAYPDFNFTENETILVSSWNATILAVTNESVLLRHDPPLNHTIETGKWPETVINLTDTEVILRRNPEVNKLYMTTDATGTPMLATIRTLAGDYFMLDYNPPLAGHTLNFTIKLLRIV